MTEYDYSPDAWERYIETQHRIANWVDGTLKQPPCNAFAPTTPHINFLELTDNLEREQRHRYDKKEKERKKDRRHSHDQYNQDRRYRSDTEEEDHAAPRARRHRDSQASASHVSSRHHVRSSSRQESHVSSSREEKYRPTTSSRQRELSSSSREKDRSDSEYRSSSRTSYTTPTTSRSQSRQSGAVVSTGQGYVLIEKEQAPKSRSSTRASTPTSAHVKQPSSSRPRALSHAPSPTSATLTSPSKSIRTAVPVPVVSIPTTRPRGASRSQTSPLTLDLPPPGQPHVIGTDYAGYPVARRAASPATTPGAPAAYPSTYQQKSPTSAPPMMTTRNTPPNVAAPKPTRSQTTPGYEGRNSYDSSYSWHGHLATQPTSAAASPAKGSSLLKRMFTGLTLGKSPGRMSPKYPTPPAAPAAKDQPVKRVMRKRSTSF